MKVPLRSSLLRGRRVPLKPISCLHLPPIRANFCKRDRRGERGGGGKEKEKEKGKKERKRKEEKKKRRRKEGGGGHSPTRLHYSICGVKSCASFSVTTRCRCYCFPRGTSLLHFLLPAFALLLLPATAASPAPTSSPTRTSIASFTTTFRLLVPPHLCYLVLSISVSLEVSTPIHWVISDI